MASRFNTIIFLCATLSAVATILCLFRWTIVYPGPIKAMGLPDGQAMSSHPQTMSFAFLVAMGLSVLAYRTFPAAHGTLKYVHALGHTIAVALAWYSYSIMVKFHSTLGIPPLYSTHSVVGIACLALASAQYALGLLSFLLPFASAGWRRAFLPFHKYLGGAVYVMAIASLVTGAENRQRLQFEIPTPPAGFTSPTSQYANAYALLALTTGFFTMMGVAVIPHSAAAAAGADAGADAEEGLVDDGYRALALPQSGNME